MSCYFFIIDFSIKIIITIIINTYKTSELKKNAPLDLT